jgi:mannose-1-phosphate guanylyltransferase
MLTYEEAIKTIEKANNGFIVTLVLYPLSPKRVTDTLSEKVIAYSLEKTKPSYGYGFYRERKFFLWNSGMFCFKASVLLEELQKIYSRGLCQIKNRENNTEG